VSGHIFISYVREDAGEAERLALDLEALKLTVWLDRTNLAPGQRWRDAIREAIRTGDLFVACFSRAYAQRHRTHMNEELTLAIEELRARPTDRAWFIPAVLAGGEVPDRTVGAGESLRDFHWVDLDENWQSGVAKIANAAYRSGQRPPTTNPIAAARFDAPTAQWAALRIGHTLQLGTSYWRNVTHQEVRILLTLMNDGPAPVVAPYIRIQVTDPFSINIIGISSREPTAPLQLVPETAQPGSVTLIGRTDFTIYAGAHFEILQITAMIKGNMTVPECQMHFSMTSAGSGPVQGAIDITSLQIAELLRRPVEPNERE